MFAYKATKETAAEGNKALSEIPAQLQSWESHCSTFFPSDSGWKSHLPLDLPALP